MTISVPTFLKVYRDNSDGAVFKKVGTDIIMWLCNPMRRGAIGVPGQFIVIVAGVPKEGSGARPRQILELTSLRSIRHTNSYNYVKKKSDRRCAEQQLSSSALLEGVAIVYRQ
jgi:hypothetical protein